MHTAENSKEIAYNLTIKGLVQGVGFRPFVYRLADKLKLKGWTKNTNFAVIVHVQGEASNVENFIKQLREQKPPASTIEEIIQEKSQIEEIQGFNIGNSEIISDDVTIVSPDIAVCDECLEDMHSHPRRVSYPLVNCCNCGPRFTIIKGLPYDREQTTMQQFEMCDNCKTEYNNPHDRRFHAQPVACNVCGPTYTLITKSKTVLDISKILAYLKVRLSKGGLFAFKGTGGFHLACDAKNEDALFRLRSLKHRDTKPFAVMFKNLKTLKKYAHISSVEEDELLSFRKPIVILKEHKHLANSVSLNLGTIGAMLPYMPFHYLLFDNIDLDVLVLTSGNLTDEPIITDNEKALNTFKNITDGVLIYNREIYNRTDDSVITIVNSKPRILRRSRGYVPSEINLHAETEGIFAAGAELTGTFCIGKGNHVIPSQYFGDLQNFENFNFYLESFGRYKKLFRFEPVLSVADMHPDYVTTRFAEELKLPVEAIQHHHAHVASVIAENRVEEPVIGIAFDGTGYGTDGNIWGSEFLICSETKFERFAHFKYMPLPGGDKAVLEPWRSGVSYLKTVFCDNFMNLKIPFIHNLDKSKSRLLLEAAEKGINAPLSCSAGRLFDAVAAVTGICSEPTFHAEAPMRLEAAIDNSIDGHYSFSFNEGIIDFNDMWEELIRDITKKVPKREISSKFHNTIIEAIVTTCFKIRETSGINNVAISGGTFQNRYLLERTENILEQNLFRVYSNIRVPANDGGIALGQLYLAAKKRENNVLRSTGKN
jgi:hydrogenase maturation protein HypF